MDKVVVVSVQPVIFSGNYRTNIPNDSDLLIRFNSTGISVVNGCNSHQANYNAYSNNTIAFSPFASTRIACANDFDSLYLQALIASVSFSQSSNQIVLRNANGLVTIILTSTVVTPQPPSVKFFYSITPSFKIFEDYFVVTQNDPYIFEIINHLVAEYAFFLKEN